MGGRRTKKITGEQAKKPRKTVRKVKEEVKKKAGPKRGRVRGKRYSQAKEKVGSKDFYPLVEAIKLVKESSYTNFDSSVEAHINLGFEVDKADHRVRVSVTLPHGQGRKRKILVFAKGKAAEEAEKAGADKIGDEKMIERIAEGGKVAFDSVVATPEFMPKLAKIARILGPQGLMPSPKSETITDDPGAVITKLKEGWIELRTEKQPIVHTVIGKTSFPEKNLTENLKAIVEELNRVKPSKIRGEYIRSIYLKSTMGPSVKIDLTSIS